MTTLYVFKAGDKFVKINESALRIFLTKKVESASYWTSKKSAKTWLSYIKNKYSDVELKEATLKLKEV